MKKLTTGGGKPYTSSSLRSVFKSALSKARLYSQAQITTSAPQLCDTSHGAWHSAALKRNSTSSKTTEMYTQISKVRLTQVESELDNLDLDDEKNGQI